MELIAAVRFLHDVAAALRPRGARSNGVGPYPPGTTISSVLDPLLVELVRSVVDSIPLGCMATGEEIGRVVCFLASEEAGYVTGQHFYVDGGRTVAL